MSMSWYWELPERWETHRLKFFYKEVDYRSQTGNEEMLSVSHITGITPRSQKNVTMFMAESNIGLKICQTDDIVVNTMWAWMAALGVSAYYGIVSPSYGVYRALKDVYNPKYLNLLLRIEDYRAEYMRCSTGIRSSRLRLYPDKFLDIRFILPPRYEQDQIVRYLEWKVSQINKLINAKRRQIVLMQELKQAVINDAVTKDADGWITAKFKRLTISANTGESITKEYWDENGDILLYTAGQQPVRTEYINFPEKWLTTKNDILVARNGAGSVHLPVIGSIYTDHVIRFVLSHISNKRYIYYSLIVGMKKVVSEANTVSLATLNKSDWENVDISFPPLAEQQAIVAYLDEKCGNIDKIVIKLNDEIALFTEYRTRLISDVVTGKLDVRGVEVPEYEAVEDVTVIEGESANDLTENEG